MVRLRSPQVENYDFGVLRLEGREYRRDLIIYPAGASQPARVDAGWWRREGHRLDPADLEAVVNTKPDVLVVGTGYHGCLKVPPETLEFLKNVGIEVYAEPTAQACQRYNELLVQDESASGGKDIRRVVAALHLTC